MGLLDRFKAAFAKQPILYNWIWRESPLVWWNPDNERYFTEGFDRNGVVFAIVNKVAQKASTVPGYEYKVKDSKALKRVKALRSGYDAKSQRLADLILKQEFEMYEDPTDPITKLLKRPNPNMDWAQFVQFCIMNKMIYGGCPVLSNNGAVDMGNTMALYAYNPDMIQIKPTPNLMGWEQAKISFFGVTKDINPEHLYFIKYQNPRIELTGEHLFGYPPLRAGLRSLQVDNANLEAQLFIMKNKGITGTFTPENMEAMEAMSAGVKNSDELRDKMKDMLTYKGQDMSVNRPYINALLKYHSFGMDANQMGLDESKKQTKQALCHIFDFPVELIPDDGVKYNNKDEAKQYLVENTIQPHLRSIDDFVNNFLYPLNGITDRFYSSDISDMPEVQSSYQELAEKMTNTQAFSKNEIREALKWERSELPNMDVPLVSSGLVPVDQLDSDMDLDTGDFG